VENEETFGAKQPLYNYLAGTQFCYKMCGVY